jgi:hypothetical protein
MVPWQSIPEDFLRSVNPRSPKVRVVRDVIEFAAVSILNIEKALKPSQHYRSDTARKPSKVANPIEFRSFWSKREFRTYSKLNALAAHEKRNFNPYGCDQPDNGHEGFGARGQRNNKPHMQIRGRSSRSFSGIRAVQSPPPERGIWVLSVRDCEKSIP